MEISILTKQSDLPFWFLCPHSSCPSYSIMYHITHCTHLFLKDTLERSAKINLEIICCAKPIKISPNIQIC